MIEVNYVAAALLFGIGLWCILTRRNLLKIVMGLSIMEASTYVLLLSFAYRARSTAPVLLDPQSGVSASGLAQGKSPVADPMLQNVCLTAIVIGIAVTAVFLAVTVRIGQHYRSLDSDDMRQMRG